MLPEGINKLAKAIILFVCLPRSIDPLSIYAKVVRQMQAVQLSSSTSARWLLQMWESVWRQRPFSYAFSSEDFHHLSWWECGCPGRDTSNQGRVKHLANLDLPHGFVSVTERIHLAFELWKGSNKQQLNTWLCCAHVQFFILSFGGKQEIPPSLQCYAVCQGTWENTAMFGVGGEAGKPRLIFIYLKICIKYRLYIGYIHQVLLTISIINLLWPFSLHFSSYLFIITLSSSSRTEPMISSLTAVFKFYCKDSLSVLLLKGESLLKGHCSLVVLILIFNIIFWILKCDTLRYFHH